MKCDQSYPTYNPCDVLKYRGWVVNFWENPAEHEIFTMWHDEYLGFGVGNTQYLEDTKAMIDAEMDTISKFDRFQDLIGCRLKWFQNGYARDIKLMHRGRILKIWIVADENKVDLSKIITEAEEILLRLPEEFYN